MNIKLQITKMRIMFFVSSKNTKASTRNQISRRLKSNWKRTVKILSKLEEKGLVEKIEYNGIKIYIFKEENQKKKKLDTNYRT